MAKQGAAQDEFVDLYEVLDVPENADTDTIRKRVNALYIEAQQNLDHRNVKKRLQFQQMYEIYLPQVRHLLMDSLRRAEYDRYLQAFRTGSKVETVADSSAPLRSNRPGVVEGELGGAPGRETGGLPELVEVDPEQLAAERETMWAKWKTGLETLSDDAPSPPLTGTDLGGTRAASTPSTRTPATGVARPAPNAAAGNAAAGNIAAGNAASNRARPTPVVPRFQPPAPGTNRAPRPNAPASNSGAGLGQPPSTFTPRPAGVAGASLAPVQANVATQNAAQLNRANPAGDFERQREQQRYLLIKTSVQNAGLMWGAGTTAALFLLGCVILFVIDNAVKSYPFGMPHGAFTGLCFLVVVVASIAGGFAARKRAKRRAVAELSVLSMEELMRRSH